MDTSLLKSTLQPAKVGHRNHAGKQVTAYLAVGPVPQWPRRDKLVVFALPEAILDLPPVQAGLDDLGRSPIRIVGDDDIATESGPLASHTISVLAETHLHAVLRRRKLYDVKIQGNVKSFTQTKVSFVDGLRFAPVWRTIAHLGTHLE